MPPAERRRGCASVKGGAAAAVGRCRRSHPIVFVERNLVRARYRGGNVEAAAGPSDGGGEADDCCRGCRYDAFGGRAVERAWAEA